MLARTRGWQDCETCLVNEAKHRVTLFWLIVGQVCDLKTCLEQLSSDIELIRTLYACFLYPSSNSSMHLLSLLKHTLKDPGYLVSDRCPTAPLHSD